MRHAEAADALNDMARPLSAGGQADARRMADWLAAHEHVPERIVASPALRALETARIVADRLGIRIDVDPHLYEGGTSAYEAAAREGVLVVGHDPIVTRIVRQRAPETPPDPQGRFVPPGSLACFNGGLCTLQRPD